MIDLLGLHLAWTSQHVQYARYNVQRKMFLAHYSKCYKTVLERNFHRLGPMSWFGHRVAMSVCMSQKL